MMNFVLQTRSFVLQTRSFVSKTRNCVSKTRNCVFNMMNSADGSVEPGSASALPGDGSYPGPIPVRQDAPHAHCYHPLGDNGFALCADLGSDELFCLRSSFFIQNSSFYVKFIKFNAQFVIAEYKIECRIHHFKFKDSSSDRALLP